ncbi:MAG TPA: DUF4197 family protein [Rariglobus sp.]|jgi:hypothetical protein|nr:DUF4197 family protein [Rariglobus sp.]
MNLISRSFFFCAAMSMASAAFAADTTTTAASAASALAAFSNSDLAAGLKSGLGTVLESTLGKLVQPDALKVSPPAALAKLETASGSAGQADSMTSALNAAVAKVAPQAAELMRTTFKDVKIEDAKAALLKAPAGGTQYLQKTMGPALREKLLPVVKQAVSSAGVEEKAKALLASAGPLASLAGGKSLADIDTYVCDQVINQSFKLMSKEEGAMRANPSILENPLAQKIFSLIKK